MRNAAHNYIKSNVSNADESEQAQRYFLAPDTLNRYLWARDFNVAKSFDMYIKSVVISAFIRFMNNIAMEFVVQT